MSLDTSQAPSQAEAPAPEAEAPEAPQESSPASPEVEASPSSQAAAEAPEASESEGGETQEAAPQQGGHKRSGGFQRKIERLERQNQILLEQLQRSGVQPVQPQGQPAQQRTAEQEADAYVDGLLERKIAEREAQRAMQARHEAFVRRTQEVRMAHPDFDDAVYEASDIPTPPALQQAILTSEKGPEIMYSLAKNRAELARLVALPPFEQVREIGRLEAKLASGATPPKPRPGAKPAAPAPITPVTSRGPTSVKRVEDMSYEEYSAWRNGQRKR